VSKSLLQESVDYELNNSEKKIPPIITASPRNRSTRKLAPSSWWILVKHARRGSHFIFLLKFLNGQSILTVLMALVPY
jgi:hypothetical protein